MLAEYIRLLMEEVAARADCVREGAGGVTGTRSWERFCMGHDVCMHPWLDRIPVSICIYFRMQHIRRIDTVILTGRSATDSEQ